MAVVSCGLAGSRPEQCDDLFKAMLSRGEINEQAIWQRAVLALQAGNRSLSDYLLRKLPAEWKELPRCFSPVAFRTSPEALTLDKTFPGGVERSDMGYAGACLSGASQTRGRCRALSATVRSGSAE